MALRASLGKPTADARQAATLDQASNGRLLLNVVPGGDATELTADGVFYSHDERYEASNEYLTIWRRWLQGESLDFEGKHLNVRDAKNAFAAVQKPYPPLYFAGSSAAAHDLAAKHVDAHLTWASLQLLLPKKWPMYEPAPPSSAALYVLVFAYT